MRTDLDERILLVDLGPDLVTAIRAISTPRRREVISAAGEVPFVSDPSAYVLCVFHAPTSGGSELTERLRSLRKALPLTPLVAVCRGSDPDRIVELMRRGATDVVAGERSVERIAQRCCERALVRPPSLACRELIGTSRATCAVRRSILAAAPTHSTVLLTGETGTGKGLVARSIHEHSPRSDRPFVHVDCAALSPTVIESELFGHERGAFTGAVSKRTGRFELADRGTVFLDEIGDLDPGLQSKLLRVLQDREYERIGGSQTLRMNARVIAATSRSLRWEMEQGNFRSDLYFRLNVFRIEIPPLRDRLEDIRVLVHSALGPISTRLGVEAPEPTAAFLARLREHRWSGNVRELLNVVERMCVQFPGEPLEPEHLSGVFDDAPPAHSVGAAAAPERAVHPCGPERRLGEGAYSMPSEPERIAEILEATGGNVARAARRLGVPRSTLRYWIRRFGLADLIPKD